MNRRVAFALPALLLPLWLSACGGDAAPAPAKDTAPTRAVRVAPVEHAVLTEEIRAVGLLAPRDEARLSFKLGGVLEAVLVEEGQVVRRGQLLARLKSTEVEAGVSQASEAAAKAVRDLERGQALYKDGVATRENLDDLTTAARVAEAQLRSVQFNARYARIEAPADGVVLQKLAEANELIAPGQPVLVTGGTTRGWIVKIGVADREVVQLAPGMPAKLELDAYPGREFPAKVYSVSRSADAVTSTFAVELHLVDADAGFSRGMVARVRLPRRADERALPVLVVPQTALLEASADRGAVMVLQGQDTVQRRDVRFGRLVGGRVEVLDGLKPDELVVVDGASFVTSGDRVIVKR